MITVEPEGDPNAKTWLVGEAPGKNEERVGKPFVGGSGQILDGILKDVQIERSSIYIDNVVRERPPGNDFGIYYTDKARKRPTPLLERAHQRLRTQLEKYKPNVVIALGNEALSALTGHKGIMNWRGSLLGCGGTKVVPTIHPAMVMRMWEYRPIVSMDLARAKMESLTPNWPTPYHDKFQYGLTFEAMIDAIRSLRSKTHLAFDIETAARQILCIGFAWSKEEALCIPIFFSEQSWWSSEQEIAIVKEIRALFAQTGPKFIAQNAQFDMTYLKDLWDIDVKLWMDTMIAFHCVYPELPKRLSFLTSVYTNRPYYKSMVGARGITKGATPDDLWTYNCLDCVSTLECALAIHAELKEFKTYDFYINHSHRLIKPLMEIQRRGVKINLEKREAIRVNLDRDIKEMQARLEGAVGHELNVCSSKQMKAFLYDEMKFTPQYHRKTKQLTADQDALEYLSKKYPSPMFKLVMDIRSARKILSTYIMAPVDPDGRMRCSYLITGTVTGRLASRKSVYGSGTDLQNIPRGELVRGIFEADEGMLMVNVDLSQAESIATAYVSNAERMIAVFKSRKVDIHSVNASMIFKKPLAAITKEERQKGKVLSHAADYQVGVDTLALELGSTRNEAQVFLNQYFALCPEIKVWHLSVDETMRRTKTLTTPLGRKRMFFGRLNPATVREAVAYVPQSLVSDILNMGLSAAYDALPQGWELLLQVHDSVLAQVPKDTDPIHIWKFFKHFFEIGIDVNGQRMKIPIDIKTGDSWGNLKELSIE